MSKETEEKDTIEFGNNTIYDLPVIKQAFSKDKNFELKADRKLEVKISKIDESVKTPTKKNIGDAAYDLHFFSKTHSFIIIEPGECALLDTGLRFYFPPEYVMEIKNRSGMAAKRGLLVGPCIVDSTYSATVFVGLRNVSNEPQRIDPDERIAQAIFYRVENILFTEVEEAEYNALQSDSTRKDGCLGSTGKF